MVTSVETRQKPTIGPASLSPEWFAMRSKVIGSSEAAKAIGMSEYGTPLHVYKEKVGEIEPFQGNESTRRGRRYEPLIAEDWQEVTGRTLRLYPCPMFLHPEYKGIAATPDGEVDDDEGLEIKSTTFRMKKNLGDEGTDDIPTDWLIQGQQQMAVMGWKVVNFCVLVELEPTMYRVERNDTLIQLMIDAELELLERIRDRRPPEPNWEHSSTPRLIREIHSTINDTRIELNDQEIASWEKYERIGRMIKKLDTKRDECKARVLHGIGDHFAGLLGDGRMVRRKETKPQSYMVEKKGYIEARACKADDGRIVER